MPFVHFLLFILCNLALLSLSGILCTPVFLFSLNPYFLREMYNVYLGPIAVPRKEYCLVTFCDNRTWNILYGPTLSKEL